MSYPATYGVTIFEAFNEVRGLKVVQGVIAHRPIQPDDGTDFCPGKQYGPSMYVQALRGLADGMEGGVEVE